MNKLVCNLITRGRPARLLDTITRTLANIANPNTVLMVSVDLDDAITIEMLAAMKPDARIKVSIKEREDTLGEKYNRALSVPADLYMPMVDHTVPVTKGFDQLMLNAAALFPDGIGAVHTQMANASFAAYNAITAKWVETVGELYPTYFPYWFVDHWTDDLARMIGRISHADVMCDMGQKPPTAELREPGWWGTWFDAAYMMRRAQAEKLLAAMENNLDGYGRRCINNFPLIEHRSRWINDTVRAQNAQLSAQSRLSLQDERYQRVRKRAVDMVPSITAMLPPVQAAIYRNALTPAALIPGIPRATSGGVV